jgi:hypothetical protein
VSSPGKRVSRPAPFPIRLTDAEKATLKARAGDKPLGAYIREKALEGAAKARRSRRTPVRDADALGRVLALLGQSRIANNLNQLARSANQGSLPVTDDVEADLREACASVLEIRTLLLEALGKKAPEEPAPSLVPAFARASQKEPQR